MPATRNYNGNNYEPIMKKSVANHEKFFFSQNIDVSVSIPKQLHPNHKNSYFNKKICITMNNFPFGICSPDMLV